MEDKYDSALLGILQHEGKVDKFLNVMMGFLYRRTDFFRIMKSKEDRLGFPPDVALRMLTAIFKQYDGLARRDDEFRETKKEEEMNKKKSQSAETTKPKIQPDTQAAGENTKTKTSVKKTAKETNNLTTPSSCDTQNTQTQSSSVNKSVAQSSATTESKTQANNVKERSETTQMNANKDNSVEKSEDSAKKSKDVDEDPELARQQQEYQSNPESYNGAVRDNYTWAQSITDLDLRVKVPSYILKGRDVKVDIKKKHIKVVYKDQTGQWVEVINDDLTWDVHKDETIWSLNPGENVHINFEKKEERWWDSMCVQEPKISVRKIDASRPMSDLDQEAQAKIEEMMYNDRQKKLGLPQSHEKKTHDMLKNAWNAEGSPFKGQEFDPSQFKVDANGTVNMNPT